MDAFINTVPTSDTSLLRWHVKQERRAATMVLGYCGDQLRPRPLQHGHLLLMLIRDGRFVHCETACVKILASSEWCSSRWHIVQSTL